MISLVDSSVAIKWYVTEPDSQSADILLNHSLAAPDLIRAEVANALWKKVRRGELAAGQAKSSLSHLASAVTLLPTEPFAEMALEIAVEIKHPVYDCLFLALSRTLDFPFVTADKRLWLRSRGTPFADRVVMLADWRGDI